MNKLQHYQSKSITPVDEYAFTLSKELEELARNEVRETEQLRNNSIASMREWIREHPKILITRMDAVWLLRFPRFRKFDLVKAQDAIEKYMVFLHSPLANNWLNDLNILRPSVEKLLDSGFIFILPNRDKHGRRIVFHNAEVADINSPTVGFDVLTLQTLTFEALLEDEENQIRGLAHIANVKGCGVRHFSFFSPKFLYKTSRLIEKTLAMRHKGIHIVKVPLSMIWLKRIIMTFLNNKIKSRMQMYSNFDQVTAVDKDNLPLEFGGKVPLKEMTASWKKEMLSFHKLRMNYKDMKVRTDLYPSRIFEDNVKDSRIPLK